MRRLLAGIAVGMVLSAAPLYAFRMEKPPSFDHWDNNTFTALNSVLLNLFNIANGRYSVDYLTVTPNGSRSGQKGDLVGATFGGNFYICINTTGIQSSPTKVWKCAQAS